LRFTIARICFFESLRRAKQSAISPTRKQKHTPKNNAPPWANSKQKALAEGKLTFRLPFAHSAPSKSSRFAVNWFLRPLQSGYTCCMAQVIGNFLSRFLKPDPSLAFTICATLIIESSMSAQKQKPIPTHNQKHAPKSEVPGYRN